MEPWQQKNQETKDHSLFTGDIAQNVQPVSISLKEINKNKSKF